MSVVPAVLRATESAGTLPISLGSGFDIEGAPVSIIRTAVCTDIPVPNFHPSGAPVDERFRIDVSADGIIISAATDVGVAHAHTVLRQFALHGSVPLGTIEDAPRLGWRGLTLDVARTPMTTHNVRRILDLLRSLRMNVLHLHLTDDQGWRLPIPGHPELTEVGGRMAIAGRPGFAWDAPEYADLVSYALEQGVWIVPEIDMPGHVGALIAAHPELARGSGTPGEYASRLHLDADDDDTLTLLAAILQATADMHPGPYVHLGGDEAFGMVDGDYERFLRHVVARSGLDPDHCIAWQEAVRAHAGIGTLQVWRDLTLVGLETDPEVRAKLGLNAAADLTTLTARGREDVAQLSSERRRVILSPLLVAYLDRAYDDDPALIDAAGLSAIGLPIYKPRTVQQSFDFSLDTVIPGLDGSLVEGVEAALWTETVPNVEVAERMLLPRLAGIAQRAWEHEPAPWAAHRERVAALAPLWERMGLRWFPSSEIWND